MLINFLLILLSLTSCEAASDEQPSTDLQLKNTTSDLTLEDRLRLLEETLSSNSVTEGDSVEEKLTQLERTLLAANSRVSLLESKLRRAILALNKDASVEDKQGERDYEIFEGGVSYVHWGRSLCNDSNVNATNVYAGYMAGAAYNKNGGGANLLCLHENPQWNFHKPGIQSHAGQIYGAEFRNQDHKAHAENIDPFLTRNNDDQSVVYNPIPCAVCFVPRRSTWLMIPARTECPESWTLEYKGYIMSAATGHGHHKNDYECIDEAPNVGVGATNQGHTLLYPVQVGCGILPCSIFISGIELTCVVCSR